MASRKAETETPGSNVSEATAKSAVVGDDSKYKGASSDPSYEAVTKQIAFGRRQHQQTTKESWGAYGTEVPQS